jgi:hypothetical protein
MEHTHHTLRTRPLVWHREPLVIEHAHASQADLDACREQMRLEREAMQDRLAEAFTPEGA